jgi:hypothetical protein
MENILFLIVIALMVAWGIGYFGYSATGPIHILLGISTLIVVLCIIRKKLAA